MPSIAVGRLDEHDVGLGHRLGSRRIGAAVPAEVAREHHDPAIGTPHVVSVTVAEPRMCPARRKVTASLAEVERGIVGLRTTSRSQRALRILGGVERQRRGVLRGAMAVREVRVLLLQVGRVEQQDLEQVGGGRACSGSGPRKPRRTSSGSAPEWSMCACEKHDRLELRGIEGERAPSCARAAP